MKAWLIKCENSGKIFIINLQSVLTELLGNKESNTLILLKALWHLGIVVASGLPFIHEGFNRNLLTFMVLFLLSKYSVHFP